MNDDRRGDAEVARSADRRPARRRRRRRRRMPPVSVIPTLCTLGNLVAGFAAIHYAVKPAGFTGPWGWSGLTFAAAMIFIGMLFDAVDGAIARLTGTASEVGAQLDSLADMVTFGVAPAVMTVVLVARYLEPMALGGGPGFIIIGPEADNLYGRIVWGVAAAYVACAALRLARFNVETPSAAAEGRMFFRGLPSPGAAGTIASLIFLHQHLGLEYREEVPYTLMRGWALGMPLITALCAFAMVSALPYVHVINRYLRGKRSFRSIVWLVVPLILVIWYVHYVVAAAFTVYALSAPVQQIWRRAYHRKRDAQV